MSWSKRALKAAIDYFGWGLTYDRLTDFGIVPPFIQVHLKEVYFTLSKALACMSIGYGLNIYTNLGGGVTILGIIGSSAWFWKTDPWREVRRVRLLMVVGFCIGVSLDRLIGLVVTFLNRDTLIRFLIRMDKAVGGRFIGAFLGALIKFFIRLDQRNIFFALIGNAMTFSIFGFAARYLPRRLELYLVGALCSYSLVVVLLASASAYAVMGFKFFWFGGYVVAYSQEIVIQARSGNNRYTQHAATLYLHMIPFTFNLGRILVRRLQTRLRNLIPRN